MMNAESVRIRGGVHVGPTFAISEFSDSASSCGGGCVESEFGDTAFLESSCAMVAFVV